MRSAARRRSHASYLALAAILATLVLTVGLTGAAPAQAATGTPVVGVASGRCLDVIGNVKTTGTRVNIWDCNGQANQAWTLTAAGELRVYDGARCLDVARQRHHSPGGSSRSTPATGGANQKWRRQRDGTIVGVQSGLCLDVTGAEHRPTAPRPDCGRATAAEQPEVDAPRSAAAHDTQPPTVPGSPRVSNLTCNSVTFAWNASTDNVGVAFYDIYHDGQQMTSVSGTHAVDQPHRGARRDLGPVRQRPRRRRQRVPGQHHRDDHPAAVPGRHPAADRADRQLTATASGTTVTLSWTAATDNVGVRAYDVYRGGVERSAR